MIRPDDISPEDRHQDAIEDATSDAATFNERLLAPLVNRIVDLLKRRGLIRSDYQGIQP